MKYFEVDFQLSPLSQDACDILAALTADAGFESFEETQHGIRGYVQQPLLDRQALEDIVNNFPIMGTNIIYTISEAEDKDWNEQWEQEGFEPIIVGNNRLAIHDGRHLPTQPADISVEIDARLAFGTGTHETTQMICEWMLDMPMKDLRVMDAGCGTGILGIVALKLKANHVTAYDIDEWSSDNTCHNAVINRVDSQLSVYCGDASLLDSKTADYDLVLANINRNILLNDMPRFCQIMKQDAKLILSGFYTEDIPLLEARGKELGLTLTGAKNRDKWASIIMQRVNNA
ncbi:50S ribosomal protein L11 methyltransferase [Prevotella sp. P3-120]|uniref:50S ribosomal protein L11 methyltransferase n=1 Tax=unclassified Prevotella TaxID=2638335 RepID=UPI000B9780E5|nr:MULTISPECIES: 50S ribosomal protein L11 methyltransferase [unclassified Prevotella]OYP51287.1 50S ribosomal protein L11 methyltransferase [Prevotella sp. P3-120]OYP52787.1 50S ribosomal protein L11 methyltransferase [Prevotella sp. P3-92]